MNPLRALPLLLLFTTSLVFADSGPQHQVKQTPPVKMGTSGGSANDSSKAFCCGGTLGSAVLYDGMLHILSNNHILARSGAAATGEDTLQPGLIDSSCRATGNIVGDFIGNVIPLGANVDAALSKARSGMVDSSGTILDVGVPCSNIQAATIGLPVMKSGRTTGFTTGTVQSISMTVQIQYQQGCGKGKKFNVLYTNQIATGNMSAGGDSGSLLVSNDGTPNPVGLLYAGSNSTTIYNPIQDVVNAFVKNSHTFLFAGNNCGGTTLAGIEPMAAAFQGVTPGESDVDEAKRIKERHENEFFLHPGVLGVGVGAAEDNPVEAAIVLYVESPRGQRPDGLPDKVEGKKVRVILTDTIVAQ
ncbi:MAG: hypothetical protein V1495_00880 [Pseudomonadota bacterium]